MRQTDIAPAFAQAITFPDVDAATIAAEDSPRRASASGAWDSYMHKILPPLPPHASRRSGLRLLEVGCF